jgi:esterase
LNNDAVELHHRSFEIDENCAGSLASSRRDLVILHGFLGGSRSWMTVARRLAEAAREHRQQAGTIHVLDLRNHGRSPWAEPHDYPAMAADVVAWLEQNTTQPVALMGHSMGGKVAMRVACDRPDLVARLYALDIAPVDYPLDRTVIDGLLDVDLKLVETRGDAEEQLRRSITDHPTRLFLLTNLTRNDGASGEHASLEDASGEGDAANEYRWAIPLDIFDRDIEKVFRNPLIAGRDSYPGPTLFVSGADSNYVDQQSFEAARKYFPAARWVALEGAGHNVHTDGGDRFVDTIGDWWR